MSATSAPGWFIAAQDALHAGDVAGFLEMYADDAVHEFPWAPEGRPQRLEGKAAIARYMEQLPAMVQFDSDAFNDMQVREAGDELIVEATATGTRPGTGEPFYMQYVWFITHNNGRVTHFKDYMNPLLLRST